MGGTLLDDGMGGMLLDGGIGDCRKRYFKIMSLMSRIASA